MPLPDARSNLSSPVAGAYQVEQGGAGDETALGVINLDVTRDLEHVRRDLRQIATTHELELVDVLTFQPADWRWVFRVVEAVHRFGVHAVIIENPGHLHGLEKAVTGVADLVTRFACTPYLGYGGGHVRPSAAVLGGAR